MNLLLWFIWLEGQLAVGRLIAFSLDFDFVVVATQNGTEVTILLTSPCYGIDTRL
jgi:hypothetical protein